MPGMNTSAASQRRRQNLKNGRSAASSVFFNRASNFCHRTIQFCPVRDATPMRKDLFPLDSRTELETSSIAKGMPRQSIRVEFENPPVWDYTTRESSVNAIARYPSNWKTFCFQATLWAPRKSPEKSPRNSDGKGKIIRFSPADHALLLTRFQIEEAEISHE